jgi:hypothetical protein
MVGTPYVPPKVLMNKTLKVLRDAHFVCVIMTAEVLTTN